MNVPTYRITEKKLKEYLGEEWEGYFNPLKSGRFRLAFYVSLYGVLLSVFLPVIGSFLKISPKLNYILQRLSPILAIIIVLMMVVFYFLMKDTFRHEIAGKMKELVNDSELLWVNSSKLPEETVPAKWQRHRGTYFTPTTFLVLSYLKKEGSSQSMYKKIKTMKNSNSAYQTLKRLSEKKIFDEPIVKREGNDFKYVPWKFKIIDEHNHSVGNSEAKEKLLAKCWEEGLEE